MATALTLDDLRAAQARIAGVAVRTPLVRLDAARMRRFGVEAAAEIYLKDESAQPIRSFKLRGAYNRIAQLSAEELARGVITYSSGNHAQGVAYAARALGSRAVIVMPHNTPPIKLEATRALGAEIVLVGAASSERRERAEALAAEHGYTIVPPYDDPAIVAGQATCGLEILEQLAELDEMEEPGHAADDLVLSPVSGGGLLSGVATGIHLLSEATGQPAPPVWGVEPELAADAYASFTTGKLTEWPAADTTRTLADGLRTQSLGQLNFALIRAHVQGIVTVSEAEIRRATSLLLQCSGLVPEPSGAVTLAAALFHADQLPAARRIVVIVSGGNLDPALQAELADPMQAQSHPAETLV